jgi:hypothetical protein
MGFLYTATLVIGVKNCNSVQPLIGIERVVFYRERAAGMYSALAYAVSQASVFTHSPMYVNKFVSTFSNLHLFFHVGSN